jgi:hypothetical protein
MKATTDQLKAAFAVLTAVADTIRELGSIPSGHLYAQLMSRMDFETYTRLVDRLKGAGLVTETRSNELVWIGPKVGA